MGKSGRDFDRPLGEAHSDLEHLGREVAVSEPSAPQRAAPLGPDPDADLLHERLQSNRELDRACQGTRGPPRDRGPKVLVEDPAELDAGLEQEGLARGEPSSVGRGRNAHGEAPAPAAGRSRCTVNGPIT
jgi:hypothetical protein